MGASRVRVDLGVVREVVVLILLGTSYIDRSVKQIHPAVRKIFPYHTLPAAILMVHKAGSKAAIDKSVSRQEVTKGLALLVTLTRCDLKFNTVALQVAL